MKVKNLSNALGAVILLAMVAVLAARPSVIAIGGGVIASIIKAAVSPVTNPGKGK